MRAARVVVCLLSFYFILVWPASPDAQTALSGETIRVAWATGQITIDGSLADEAWRAATRIDRWYAVTWATTPSRRLTGDYTRCIKRCVTAEHYRTALASAIKEYEALGEQRREIDKRLAQLAQTIGTLSKLIGLTPTVPMGLTDAVRLALRSGVPMSPMEVRERLLAIGVDLSIYSSDLAVIHTVLKRLNEAGEIRLVPRANGKHQYLWAAPPTVLALGPEIAEYIRHTTPERAFETIGAAIPRKPPRKRTKK